MLSRSMQSLFYTSYKTNWQLLTEMRCGSRILHSTLLRPYNYILNVEWSTLPWTCSCWYSCHYHVGVFWRRSWYTGIRKFKASSKCSFQEVSDYHLLKAEVIHFQRMEMNHFSFCSAFFFCASLLIWVLFFPLKKGALQQISVKTAAQFYSKKAVF